MQKCTEGSASLKHKPRMLVLSLFGKVKLLLFSTGSLTVTGLKNLDYIGLVMKRAVQLIRRKIRLIYGISYPLYSVTQFKIKTILAKSKFLRVICPIQLIIHKLPGMQPRDETYRNAFTIKRNGVSLNVFSGTGSVIVFGNDFTLMESIFSQIVCDVCHIQSLCNAPLYSTL